MGLTIRTELHLVCDGNHERVVEAIFDDADLGGRGRVTAYRLKRMAIRNGWTIGDSVLCPKCGGRKFDGQTGRWE